MSGLIEVRTIVCPVCNTDGVVCVDQDEFEALKTNDGLIQDVMPTTPSAIREQLKTGIHGECWKAISCEEDEFSWTL
jgi:hypothetical protein